MEDLGRTLQNQSNDGKKQSQRREDDPLGGERQGIFGKSALSLSKRRGGIKDTGGGRCPKGRGKRLREGGKFAWREGKILRRNSRPLQAEFLRCLER